MNQECVETAGGDPRPEYLNLNGGLEMTRTSDLFRVKEAKSITYDALTMKTQGLRVHDLDLKWTAAALSGPTGPHTDLKCLAM